MNVVNRELFNRFKRFSAEHKISGDIDPVYIVLREVHKIREWGIEKRIWHTLLYVTWYHMGSAEIMLARYPVPQWLKDQPKLSTGVERRGFRGNNKGCEMINDLLESRIASGSMSWWLRDLCDHADNPKERWEAIYNDFKGVKNNGTWAAYKWCDLVKNVLGFPVTAPDIGVGGGGETAGPVPGLVRLTGEDWKRCAYDRKFQEDFYQFCRSEGFDWDGLEEMETALCDFNTHSKGHYYVGHDIDLMMNQIAGIPGENDYWLARERGFPRKYLGEKGGWFGLRKVKRK